MEHAAGVADSLIPSGRTPGVVMDPHRAFGQQAIRNVRTVSIAEAYRTGSCREELAELYDLSADQVDHAIRFELIAHSAQAAYS